MCATRARQLGTARRGHDDLQHDGVERRLLVDGERELDGLDEQELLADLQHDAARLVMRRPVGGHDDDGAQLNRVAGSERERFAAQLPGRHREREDRREGLEIIARGI